MSVTHVPFFSDTFMPCAIGDDETGTVLITGGRIYSDSGTAVTSRVSRYNTTGWMEDIAELNQARAVHACSSYLRQNGERVETFHHTRQFHC